MPITGFLFCNLRRNSPMDRANEPAQIEGEIRVAIVGGRGAMPTGSVMGEAFSELRACA